MLEINNYNSEILHNITFSLLNGENLIILGNNGAGKSTLAKVLCSLITSSNVKLFNEELFSLNDLKRAEYINYIPPKLVIFDEYISLREYLELSFITNVNKEKIDKIIALLKLEKLEFKSCSSFSSGEQQLVLLASSLVHNAKITIFDELSANLDITRIKELFEIFKSNHLKQKIIITHNLDLAYALKFKVLYLEDGKIRFFGSHKDFFEDDNLKNIYNNSIKKINNHLVVNL